MNRQKSFFINAIGLWFIAIILPYSSISQIPNKTVLGSEHAQIEYIKGTGSNIGLYAGLFYFNNRKYTGDPPIVISTGKSCYYIPAKQPVYVGGPGGSAIRRIPDHVQDPRYNFAELENRHLKSNLIIQDLKTLEPVLQTSSQNRRLDLAPFRLTPMSVYGPLGAPGNEEILVPTLCGKIFEEVPDPNPSQDFEKNPDIPNSIAKANVGIYRFDDYLNNHVISHAWINGNQIASSSALKNYEREMLPYCEFELDSSTLNVEPIGFYDIKHAFLRPGFANYPVWAAAENQDTESCIDGIRHISEAASKDTAFVNGIFKINYLVLGFAGLDSISERFDLFGFDSPIIPNLNPYSIIIWYPDVANTQNIQNGINFFGDVSFDAEGDFLSYAWDFGDGGQSNDINPIHQFLDTGLFKVTLMVEDHLGATAKDSVYVQIDQVISTSIQQTYSKKAFLEQSYPNPFSDVTTFKFFLPKTGQTTMRILNFTGQFVAILEENHTRPSGWHELNWDARDKFGNLVSNGIYFLEFKVNNSTIMQKLVFAR